MKILHIHPSMGSGGIEAMICGLVNEMAKVHDVTLCTIFRVDKSNVFEQKLSPLVHRVDLGKTRPGFSVKEIFKVYQFIRKGHYDVVHIHGFFYYYALTVFLLHKKVRFVYTIHSDAVKENSTWDRRLLFLKKHAFRKEFVHPITISKVSKASFEAYYGLDSTLIYNGIPAPKLDTTSNKLGAYRLTQQTKLFFHPGRITEAKNQLTLVKVFKQFEEEGRDVVLLIAGAKQDEHIWKEIKPYFSKRIIYLGERSDVVDLMAEADAFCLPSIWEGLPVTLLEALSVGCIPICSPVGGIPEIVEDGCNGFLAKDSGEMAYYKAVSRYLKSSAEDIAEMKKACEALFDKYRITEVAKRYLVVYEGRNHKKTSL